MDQFNLSRYANLTVQRVQPPEAKPPPKATEDEEEEDCSDEEDDFSGCEDEAIKVPEVSKIETTGERSDAPTLTDENVEVKLEPEITEDQPKNEGKNNEQNVNDEEIESNSKRKSGEEDDQALKKAKMNEESMYICCR